MNKVELLQDKFNEIKKYKNDGMRNEDIAKLYNTSKSTITRLFQANNIYSRNLMNKEKTTPLIIKDYEDGLQIHAIAKKYHTSQETVSSILKENNIEIRPAYKVTYSINENYFDTIDTPEKAYIIGMIASDGCVFCNRLQIVLQEEDKDILEKINSCLGSNRQLYYIERSKKNPNWKNQYSLIIVNKHIADQLKSIGLIENKSLSLEFPNVITDKLLPHFLRGLLDGDGFLEKKRYRVGYTGTPMLLEEINNRINRILGINFYIHAEKCKNNSTSTMKISNKKDCINFLNYIYKDASIYMNRKYNLYQNYINESLSV